VITVKVVDTVVDAMTEWPFATLPSDAAELTGFGEVGVASVAGLE
jgi:hypothetical protein